MVIDGRYRIDLILSAQPSHDGYLASDLLRQHTVLLRSLRIPGIAQRIGQLQTAFQDAQLVGVLQRGDLVPILGFGADPQLPGLYLVMAHRIHVPPEALLIPGGPEMRTAAAFAELCTSLLSDMPMPPAPVGYPAMPPSQSVSGPPTLRSPMRAPAGPRRAGQRPRPSASRSYPPPMGFRPGMPPPGYRGAPGMPPPGMRPPKGRGLRFTRREVMGVAVLVFAVVVAVSTATESTPEEFDGRIKRPTWQKPRPAWMDPKLSGGLPSSDISHAQPIIEIRSTPSGATVQEGVRILGSTPLRFPRPKGAIRLTVKVEGYRPAPLQLNSGSPNYVNVILVRGAGQTVENPGLRERPRELQDPQLGSPFGPRNPSGPGSGPDGLQIGPPQPGGFGTDQGARQPAL